MNMNILGKDLEKAKQRRELPSSLKKIVSLIVLVYHIFTDLFFKMQGQPRLVLGFTAHIFLPESRPFLSLVANIGPCLFLFLVGLEIDAGRS